MKTADVMNGAPAVAAEKRIAAYQLVEYLERLGVEVIFGLCGHTVIAFLDALEGHTPLLTCPVSFNPAGHGYPILRAGNYVVVNHDINGADYILESNERLACKASRSTADTKA